MTTLEQELFALGAEAFPPTPDLAAAVRRRIDTAPAAAPWWRRRAAIALAVAVLIVAGAAAMAVPDARSTILRWLRIGSVQVELVDRLPPVPVTSELVGLGARVDLADARRRAGYRVLVPAADGLGGPDTVYLRGAPEPLVSLVYGTPTQVKLLISETPGFVDARLGKKIVGSASRIEFHSLFGASALWIEGAPHEFFFVAPNGSVVPGTLRLARNTLVAQRNGLTIRIEGNLDRDQAIRIARSLR